MGIRDNWFVSRLLVKVKRKNKKMENKVVFGTYNVPPISDSTLTASFTVESNLSKEMLEKIYATETEINNEDLVEYRDNENTFDYLLKGVLAVPKPTKSVSK